jgi:hypothetical protein
VSRDGRRGHLRIRTAIYADTTSSYDPYVPDESKLPSLAILVAQVSSEREGMNTHAESLDTKAGVVLGFAGVLARIQMVQEAADLVKRKGRRIRLSVGCLATAAALVVAGTIVATGGGSHA